MTADPRKTALLVLNALDSGHSHLDRIIAEQIDDDAPDNMSKRDRRLAYALIYGVLRWRGRLDWIIGRFSNTSIEKIRAPIFNILRIGLYQILYMDRVPDSAAVNTSVEMAKEIAPRWTVRYVNGMLRNCCRKRNELIFTNHSLDTIDALALEKSFPKWLVERWIRRFDYEGTKALCDWLNRIPLLTVRANTGKVSRAELLSGLKDISVSAVETKYSPVGICMDTPVFPVHEMAVFQNGAFQVQDEAAQVVGYVLAPRPGESVLDACAGLGGKTGHIAQLMSNTGTVVALDTDGEKLTLLASEMARLGNTNVTTCCHDLTSPVPQGRLPLFDRILVDAPCSGIGVIRRNPDIKWSMRPERFRQLQARQILLLNHASKLLKPGGVLVYAVCSMEPEETTSVINAFKTAHPRFSGDATDSLIPLPIRQMMGESGQFYTFPHVYDMDGFFIARMTRKA